MTILYSSIGKKKQKKQKHPSMVHITAQCVACFLKHKINLCPKFHDDQRKSQMHETFYIWPKVKRYESVISDSVSWQSVRFYAIV